MTEIAKALDATAAFVGRYVVFARVEQAWAVALWVGHSWVYDQFDTSPYLAIQSPGRRSGKSRLQECLGLVTRQALPMAGASLAALFRVINDRHPTLLLDEADTIFNKRTSDSTEDVRGLLNNGYRRGVPFLRVVGDGKKMRVESFDVFCPKAIASIHALPDTVQDRSIVIAMKRRARSEAVARFRFRVAELEALPIKEHWEVIAADIELPEQAAVPDALDDRAADSWEPLLALADAAGGEWPERARRAALALSGAPEIEDDTSAIRLLAGIREVFVEKGVDRLATAQLLEALRADEEAPWDEWHHGRGLRPEGLAYLLRPYGIRARQLKVDGVNVRGFELEVFADAFSRYLPPRPDSASTRYPVTAERESEHDGSKVAGGTPVAGGGQKAPVAGLNGHPADELLPFPWPDEDEDEDELLRQLRTGEAR